MASGLFELRKDPITGWWVATIVDRAFHRDRFARAAELVDDKMFGCANCSSPAGDGVRTRMLKDFAFHVVGTDVDARELDRDHGLAQVSLAQARATGSWRTVIAPPGEHRPLHAVGTELIEALVTGARDALAESRATGADRVPHGRPELGRAGGRPDEPPVPGPVRPAADPAPDRRGAGWGGALRDPRRGVPVLPSRPRRVAPARPARLGGRRQRGVRARTRRVRHSRSGSCRVATMRTSGGRRPADIRATAEALRNVLGRLATALDGPPYNLVLHTAPLREQVDGTYHWHWEIHPRLREIAGLELGTGLPVNPVSPEDAVEELLGRSGPEGGGSG